MGAWFADMLAKSSYFMPHGHCYLWIPSLLWLHVISDTLIGAAYVGISLLLYGLVRKLRLPFSPVFVAFGLFIGLCGLTHFFAVWTVWNPDYWSDGVIKAATATASVATAVGLFFIKPQIEEFVHVGRLSEERRVRLESAHAELETLYRKVKEADAVKTEFFANVSHELRTPLALILGPAEQMLADPNLPAEHRRHLQSIASNGKMLLKQVNDLLDAARMESGSTQVRYARLDLAQWFRRIASQFEIAAEQRAIRLRIHAPDSLPAEADPDMLERVFINLLSNAFKFTPDGGEIEARIEGDHDQVGFSVGDSGPGVPPEQRDIIFERFRQGDGGATRRHGGTGLGLAIAHDFVTLHGGSIEVGTSAQGGARFTVRLPAVAPGQAQVDEAPQALAPVTQVALEGALQELRLESRGDPDSDTGVPAWPQLPGRPGVLVVEDNPDMRAFVGEVLHEEYNVQTAADGAEGLARAQAMRPDLIVTDLMMPRMSGDQMLAALRVHEDLSEVPVLLLTARADEDLRIRLLEAGAQDYLNKPFRAAELLARARNLSSAKRAGDVLRRELSGLSGTLEQMAGQLALKHRQLQVALETAEVAREQAEGASQVKSEFLAMLSHELRTPLTTIQLNLDLIARQQALAPAGSSLPRMDRMSKAVRQMSVLIEGLLEYTRAESGRIDVRLSAIDPAILVKEVVGTHVEGVPPAVQLVAAPSAGNLAPLQSDARLLRVALDNLVSNALKFTHEGVISVYVLDRDGSHVFEVHDTGIGIPEEDLPRIFLPFERLEPIQRKNVPGVGLGLALVKRIAHALHGEVEVTSQPGAGSTFRLTVPSSWPQSAGMATGTEGDF